LNFKTTDEQVICIVDNGKINVVIVQMAAYMIRRVISYVQKGEEVTTGQRIGRIKFGSQVDLVLPNRKDLDIIVKPGDRLKAGETIVAILYSAID
jgi:phosphatidylserine decarboxylase